MGQVEAMFAKIAQRDAQDERARAQANLELATRQVATQNGARNWVDQRRRELDAAIGGPAPTARPWTPPPDDVGLQIGPMTVSCAMVCEIIAQNPDCRRLMERALRKGTVAQVTVGNTPP